MSIIGGRVRRWIDANLVQIGVAFFFVGVGLTVLVQVQSVLYITALAEGDSISLPLGIYYLMARLSPSLTYVSVFLIGVGVLLRNWNVTLIGFENTQVEDLTVEGPNDDNIVWIGTKYQTRVDADLAALALSKRLTRLS